MFIQASVVKVFPSAVVFGDAFIVGGVSNICH